MIIYERFGSNQLFRFYTFPNGNDPRFFILTVTKIILNFILLKLKKKYLRQLDQGFVFFQKEFYDQELVVDAYKKLMKETISFLNPNIGNLDEEIENIYGIEKELSLVRY